MGIRPAQSVVRWRSGLAFNRDQPRDALRPRTAPRSPEDALRRKTQTRGDLPSHSPAVRRLRSVDVRRPVHGPEQPATSRCLTMEKPGRMMRSQFDTAEVCERGARIGGRPFFISRPKNQPQSVSGSPTSSLQGACQRPGERHRRMVLPGRFTPAFGPRWRSGVGPFSFLEPEWPSSTSRPIR